MSLRFSEIMRQRAKQCRAQAEMYDTAAKWLEDVIRVSPMPFEVDNLLAGLFYEAQSRKTNDGGKD